jgi:hypothetical protein
MAEPRTVDEERAYIESLLNTRFNYYILFVSLLLVPIANENSLTQTARVGLLGFGALVSALMAYMVMRTKLLLDTLLKEIVEGPADHPYKRACQALIGRKSRFTRNANDMMVLLVFLIMLFFLVGVVLAAGFPDVLLKTQNATRVSVIGG